MKKGIILATALFSGLAFADVDDQLREAIRNGEKSKVINIISNEDPKIDENTLVLALIHERIGIFNVLVESEKTPNAEKTEMLCSRVRESSDDNKDLYKQVIQKLIDSGADVNGDCRGYGESPLDRAKNIDAIRILLANNAKVSTKMLCKMVDMSIPENNEEKVKMYRELLQLVINQVDDINGKCNDSGKSILQEADNLEAIKLLVENGAKIDAQDDNGLTALHVAYWTKGATEYLLKQNADANIKSKKGETALDMLPTRVTSPRDHSDIYTPREVKKLAKMLINKMSTENVIASMRDEKSLLRIPLTTIKEYIVSQQLTGLEIVGHENAFTALHAFTKTFNLNSLSQLCGGLIENGANIHAINAESTSPRDIVLDRFPDILTDSSIEAQKVKQCFDIKHVDMGDSEVETEQKMECMITFNTTRPEFPKRLGKTISALPEDMRLNILNKNLERIINEGFVDLDCQEAK